MKDKKTLDQILHLLKTEGSLTAGDLGKLLNITSMGARGHLEKLMDKAMVGTRTIRIGVGRPRKTWHLTQKAHSQFPDCHDQLTLDMIISIKEVFGGPALSQLIEHRSQSSEHIYQKELIDQPTLESKIAALVRIRTSEGYMASYIKEGDVFLFIENHCPICAAAQACQNFCHSELRVFKNLFTPEATVNRIEYILDGARRCTYRIEPTGSPNQ
ncbi:helix-turn-helix transcriptional regulator [Endozoicomonas sp.]|uniref:helix-turn-helix transcriptional regulator n=1 Tax=Endozoicomonas sp. TaxID=1892382 RepID=UPI003AF4C2FB